MKKKLPCRSKGIKNWEQQKKLFNSQVLSNHMNEPTGADCT